VRSMGEKKESILTGAQLRAARVMLGLTTAVLAEKTKLGVRTIKRAEQGDGAARLTAANRDRIIMALEQLGIEFIPPNGGGPGVRLKRAVQRPRRSAIPRPGK
jgi:hypothetical protein